MSTNDIINTMGTPGRAEGEGGNIARWRYALPPFPADDQMTGTHVIGVTMTLTNGHLAHWGCTYVGSPALSVEREETLTGKGGEPPLSALKFFIVSGEPKPGLKFIDTPHFPELGYIPNAPSLVISRVRNVTLKELKASNNSESVWSFRVSIPPQDASALKAITATNIGQQLLIAVGDEPIIAPRIVSPLETGDIEIECSERDRMMAVRQALERISRE